MKTAIERFFSKVVKTDNCWEWTGAKHGSRQKRGCFWDGNRRVDSARWIFSRTNPTVPIDGLCILHSCDNPLCVNPSHLSPGTQAENVRQMHERKRAHQYTDPSVGVRAALAMAETLRREPHRRAKGERHGNAKLTDAERHHIQTSGEQTKILAARYGVGRTCIQRVRKAPPSRSLSQH